MCTVPLLVAWVDMVAAAAEAAVKMMLARMLRPRPAVVVAAAAAESIPRVVLVAAASLLSAGSARSQYHGKPYQRRLQRHVLTVLRSDRSPFLTGFVIVDGSAGLFYIVRRSPVQYGATAQSQ